MIKLLALAALFAVAGNLSGAAVWTELPKLTPMAVAISNDAARGEWSAAQRDASTLRNRWMSLRPSVATTRLQTAHAETIDASIAWMDSAIRQRDAGGVHDAAALVERTVRHLIEDHGSP